MLKKKRTNLRSLSKDEESLSDISDISCPEQPEFHPVKSKPKKIRHKFTYVQDKKMLEYIMNENRYDEIKGLSLWKDMETLQITEHSKQSMRCRFLKILIPNLHQYDIPKRWVDKLTYQFPELQQKHPNKENAKTDFPCSMLDKWKRQSPRLKSSPHQAENDSHETRTGNDVSGSKKTSKRQAENEDGDGKESCDSTEPFTESPVVRQGTRKRICRQSLVFDSSSESDTENKKVALTKSITPRRNKRRLAKQSLQSDSSSQSNVEGEDEPVSESHITPQRRTKQLSKQSLQFDSSSESNAKDEQEKDVLTPGGSGGPSPAISADPSPSKSDEDGSKDDDDEMQSDLSDYDQYLLEMAKKTASSEKSPRQSNDVSQSETTREECVSNADEDEDEDEVADEGSVSVVEDRRSRLQHRRHLKKIKNTFAHNSTPTTSPSPKKAKKANLSEFVTNSYPEEILSENEDIETCSSAKDCDELSEYETIISDISTSYGLTNHEVLSTIFSFNGDIEKSIAYITLGPELSQLEPWTKEEDQIISSTDEANIKTIAAKRGNKLIAERLQFLENFSEDFMNN